MLISSYICIYFLYILYLTGVNSGHISSSFEDGRSEVLENSSIKYLRYSLLMTLHTGVREILNGYNTYSSFPKELTYTFTSTYKKVCVIRFKQKLKENANMQYSNLVFLLPIFANYSSSDSVHCAINTLCLQIKINRCTRFVHIFHFAQLKIIPICLRNLLFKRKEVDFSDSLKYYTPSCLNARRYECNYSYKSSHITATITHPKNRFIYKRTKAALPTREQMYTNDSSC